MLYTYFRSFNLRFKGRACRKEFFAVIIPDIIILLIMAYKLYLLNDPSQVTFSPFLRSVFTFFNPYSKIIYMICLGWISARYAAWQAVGVRRLHDVGLPDHWLLIPFYNKLSMLKAGNPGKNAYGENPCN